MFNFDYRMFNTNKETFMVDNCWSMMKFIDCIFSIHEKCYKNIYG